jgi:hypothetical protein
MTLDKSIPSVPARRRSWFRLLNPFGICLVACLPFCAAAQTNCVPPPDGMVGWWKGDGDGTDYFSTNNGTPLYGVTFDPGEVGLCFHFDSANNQRVYIPDNPAFQLTNSLTIEGWFKLNAGSALFVRGDNRPGLDPYGLSLQPDLTAAFFIEDDTGTAVIVQTPAPMPTGVWLHLAATLEDASGTMSIYTNGVLAAQTNTTIRPMGPLDPTQDPSICIGNVSGKYIAFPFDGWADEVALYSRALSQSEIQSIFAAGSFGKCPPPPEILTQPSDQTATVGNTAHFTVIAAGAASLTYQWTFFSTNLPDATNATLVLPNVGPADAGPYAVLVSNAINGITSSNATLNVLATPSCVSPGSNLISWWRAEGDALDQITGNDGTLVGNATFTPGRSGQGFLFDGNASAVIVSNPPSLQLQDFTIEAWIARGDPAIAASSPGGGLFLSYGTGGYGFGINDNGTLLLSRIDLSEVTSMATIVDTNLHYVAVTKTGTTVLFYIDGMADPAVNYGDTFNFNSPAAIGARGDTLANNFIGMVDELSIYDRPLSPSELQLIYTASFAGKCLMPVAPFLVTSPVGFRVTSGASATLSAVAAGSGPLSYQWEFNGTNLVGATSSSLTLTNARPSQSGGYSVVVTNSVGSVTSAVAQVSIVFPPATVRLTGTNVTAGAVFSLPITITANGNENAIGFSLSWFGGTTLSFVGAALGSDVPGAIFLANTSQVSTNRLGLAVALPAGTTLSPGVRQIATVTFAAAAGSPFFEVNVNFSDAPTPRQLWDAQLTPLAANYFGAQINIVPAAGYEGDIYPRPNGGRTISLIDWLQAGRYAARLDYPTNATQFQRADCAPRSTLGDGAIKVSDWVQVGRYAMGLDPLAALGGPTNEIAVPGPSPSLTRLISLVGANVNPGDDFDVSVGLAAQGNENALGASVSFDPTLATFVGGSVGADASGATLYLNSSGAAAGQLGIALSLGPGAALPAGNKELVRLSFHALGPGNLSLAFGDLPVPRETADVAANPLAVSFLNGSLQINGSPLLTIAHTDQSIALSWPLWASNFVVQQATNGLVPATNWMTVPTQPAVIGDQNILSFYISNWPSYFRLFKP